MLFIDLLPEPEELGGRLGLRLLLFVVGRSPGRAGGANTVTEELLFAFVIEILVVLFGFECRF